MTFQVERKNWGPSTEYGNLAKPKHDTGKFQNSGKAEGAKIKHKRPAIEPFTFHTAALEL